MASDTALPGLADRQTALEMVRQNGDALRNLPRELQRDPEIVMAAVKRDGDALRFAASDLKSNSDIVLAAVKQNGYAFQHAARWLQCDRDFVLEAVKQDGYALQFAAKPLQEDREIVKEAVTHDGYALVYAAAELQSDRQIVIAALQRDGRALQYVAQKLRCDRQVVFEAVKQNSVALRYAAEELQCDQSFILEAVKQDGFALRYASSNLQGNREIVLAAVTQNGRALQFAAAQLKLDAYIVLEAVKQNGYAFQHAAFELRADRDVVLLAVKEDGCAIQYAERQLQDDPMVRSRAEKAAILRSGSRINFGGNIKPNSLQCVVSFPGKYAEEWYLATEEGRHNLSVACVFLTTVEEGFGVHENNPQDPGRCYCHTIYGHRGYKNSGYLLSIEKGADEVETRRKLADAQLTNAVVLDERQQLTDEQRESHYAEARRRYEASGCTAAWGCRWFHVWKERVEEAVQLNQQLIVYFFAGQVGEGKVRWENLANECNDPWDGVGLGGSQKCEVAYLDRMLELHGARYQYQERDIRAFRQVCQ